MVLSPEIQSRIEAYKTSNTLWKAPYKICEGSNEIKAIKKDTLRPQYENFSHLKGESVPQKLHIFVQLVNDMAIMGIKYDLEDINKKMLHTLPPSWKHLVHSSKAL